MCDSLAGSLTLKKFLEPTEEYELLAPARRLALHISEKIHNQGRLLSILINCETIQIDLKLQKCKKYNNVRITQMLKRAVWLLYL